MATFIMLSRLTPEGMKTLRNNPNRIKEVNQEVEQFGARVVSQTRPSPLSRWMSLPPGYKARDAKEGRATRHPDPLFMPSGPPSSRQTPRGTTVALLP
jgi:hypothetical protein